MAGSPHPTGSPGAAPKAVTQPASRWQYRFVRPTGGTPPTGQTALQALVDGIRGGGGHSPGDVIVAILDTCPPVPAPGRNPYMDIVRTAVSFDPPPSLPTAAFAALEGRLPDWGQFHDDPHVLSDYKIADHGLFVAGIIHDIAPTADTRLIRVLNDYGVGDMLALANVIDQLLTEFAALHQNNRDRRLVINMSLGSEIPPGEELLREWLPNVAQLPLLRGHLDRIPDLTTALDERANELPEQEQVPVLNVINRILLRTHCGFERVFKRMQTGVFQNHVLVVAAAGNDFDVFETHGPSSKPRREEPRWPARYDNVFGVASVRADAAYTPTEYSNRGDVRLLVNGVATNGGEATRDALNDLPTIKNPTEAIVGLFSALTVPPNISISNPNGWVAWAGTSFATPVIAAIAADLWIVDRQPTPPQIMDHIRNVFSSVPPNPANTNPNRVDTPVIYAEQVPMS
jgi:hypothetical protein